MKYTENLGLKKPELTDKVKVEDFNENSDIIDRAMNRIGNQVEEQSKLYDEFEQDNKAFNGQIINWNRGFLLNVVGADIIKQEDDIVIIKAFADAQYINIETHLLDSDSHILGLKNYNGEGILSTAGINPDTNKSVELSMTPFTNASNGFVRQVDRYKNRPFPVSRLTLAINLPIGEEYSFALDDILLANGDKHSKDDVQWDGDELQVNNFPEHFTNMSVIYHALEKQSKQALIANNTLQVILQEKIDEGTSENIDFYKSQLEKLKLTQEVDLNLLLTL